MKQQIILLVKEEWPPPPPLEDNFALDSFPSSPSFASFDTFDSFCDLYDFYDFENVDDLDEFNDIPYISLIEHVDFVFQDDLNFNNQATLRIVINMGCIQLEIHLANEKKFIMLLPLLAHYSFHDFKSSEQ